MASRVVLWLMAAIAAFAQDTGLVEGRLTNSSTHLGIPAAQVAITALTSRTEYRARTDDTGAFHITGVPRGQYTAQFQAEGYMDLEPGSPARNIFTVVPGRDPIHIEVALVPLGRLSGHVLDADGKPIAGARVEMFHSSGGGGYAAKSGKNGEFEVPSLIPGTYTLMAQSTLAIPAGDGEPRAWAPTFYPGRVERQEAEPIVVRGASTLSGYDIRIRAVPVYKVSGQLFGPDGRLLRGMTVKAMTGNNWTPDAQAVTSAAGEFELALRAGTWFLSAELEAAGKPFGVVTVTVSRAAVEGVRLRLQQRFVVMGRMEGGTAGKNVYLVPAGWSAGQAPTAKFNPSGAMRIEDVIPGRYRIMVRGAVPPNSYLESVRVGELDAMGRDVDLYEGAPPLRIVFATNPATVRGTVERGQSATVVLIPQEEHLRSEILTRTATCDLQGRFEVAGLRPGNYYAIAFDRIAFWGSLQDLVFMRPVLAQAARVEVRNGEATSLDLKVTPWPEY